MSARKFKKANTKGWGGQNEDQPPAAAGGDVLDDLEETFEDFGHGFQDDQADPNVKPKPAEAPKLERADPSALHVTFAAAGQCVEKVTVQAIPDPKKKGKPEKLFKKFSTTTKVGGKVTTITSHASMCTKATLSSLALNTQYYVRLVLKNPAGEVAGHIAGPFTTGENQTETETAKDSPKKDKASESSSSSSTATTTTSTAASTTSSSGLKGYQASLMARLAPKVNPNIMKLKSRLEEEEEKMQVATKMFSAEPKQQQSKIFKALNPESLFFESRRERAEKEEQAIRVEIRGGSMFQDETGHSYRDYSRAHDEFGNVIEEEDDEDEEDEEVDPNNLPDFGEFQHEMDRLRAERAEKQRQHQEELRKKWEAQKQAEQARLDEEIRKIEARKASEEKALGHDERFVQEAQKRLEEEIEFGFKFEAE